MKKTLLLCAAVFCSVQLFAQFNSLFTPVLVKDINTSPSSANANIEQWVEMNGKMYFIATDNTPIPTRGLYVSDGTANGTQLIMTNMDFSNLAVLGNKLVFTAYNYNSMESNLWVSDGTPIGTQVLKDINPGYDDEIYQMAVINGKCYFSGNDGVHGIEIWVSDGTNNGTQLLKDMNQGAGNMINALYTYFNRKVYYFALNSSTGDMELWMTDGTGQGTTKVTDFPGTDIEYLDKIMVTASHFYFTLGKSPGACTLWKSDGTDTGTSPVTALGNGYAHKYAVLNDKLILGYEDGSNIQILATDGTTHTNLFSYSASHLTSASQLKMQVYNGRVYLNHATAADGLELWSTDGTQSGSAIVADINPGMGDGGASSFVVYNGKLYFTGTGADGNNLCWTDGTGPGTKKLFSPIGALQSTLEHGAAMKVFKDSLYYEATYAPAITRGSALYKLSMRTTGVNEIDDVANTTIDLYPNPSSGNIALKLNGNTRIQQIEILNNLGQVVFTPAISSASQLHITLPAYISNGTYILRVKSADGILHKRFTVQR